MSTPSHVKLCVLALIAHTCSAQSLHTDLVTQLPGALTGFASVYDGDDFIYLLGGSYRGPESNPILRFSISTETVEAVGSLPSFSFHGSAQIDTSGNIFYFGGQYNAVNMSGVYKFDPVTRNLDEVTALPYSPQHISSVKDGEDSNLVYIFSGFGGDMLNYDMSTCTPVSLGSPPMRHHYPAGTRVGRSVVIIGAIQDVWFPETRTALKIDLDTMQPTIGSTDFVEIKGSASITTVGEMAYVIGGYTTDWATPTPTNGLLKLNPINFQYEFVSVENFPIGASDSWGEAPGLVYVEKLDRIYMIGGRSNMEHDQIWKIDLNSGATVAPTTTTSTPAPTITTTIATTTTTEAPDTPEVEPTYGPSTTPGHSTTPGVEPTEEPSTTPPPIPFECPAEGLHRFPLPENCALFIMCIDGGLTIYRCPTGSLFDSVRLECRLEGDAICG